MNSIKNTVVTELEINKSTFINYLYKVDSVEEVKVILTELRDKYSDANHHCYAYVIGENQEIQKFSDDGEPSKTAGLPMIEVLKKNDLTNVLVVSVRYFGGIKLGAGGLVRAYTKGASSCVKESEPSFLVEYNNIKVSIDFDMIGVCEKHIRDNYNLISTTYDSKVNYEIVIEVEKHGKLTRELTEKTKGSLTITVLDTFKKYI